MNTIKYRTKEGALGKVKITQSKAVILGFANSPYRSMRLTTSVIRKGKATRCGGKYKHGQF